MARLIAYSLLMVLFITCSADTSTKENDHTILKYNCEAKMGIPCVWEVFNTIFKIGSVTNKCCDELIVLGKVCHSALVQKTLEKPKFQNLDRGTIIQKCIDTWNNCLVLTHSPSPKFSTLYSKLGVLKRSVAMNSLYLEKYATPRWYRRHLKNLNSKTWTVIPSYKNVLTLGTTSLYRPIRHHHTSTKENDQTILKYNCEAKMGIPCVWEVFNTIFKIGSVTNKCCDELIVLGKVCHSALVQKTLEKPKFQNLDRGTIIQKCIDTWNNCLVLTHSPSPSP
ncbi:hypothetical protein GQ457_02G043130 [Hibiscus cannabinus]